MSDAEMSIPRHPEWGLALFHKPARSLSHWFAHFLMIEPTRIGFFKRNGELWIGHQCAVCGKVTGGRPVAGRNG